MSNDEKKAMVYRWLEECCNGRKLNVVDELFAPKHTYHDPFRSSIESGPEGMKQLLATYQQSFPDMVWDIKDVFVSEEGERIVMQWSCNGTHTAPLENIPPTGKRVMIEGIWIYRLADNKFAESWNVWDTLGMLQQLGVVPLPTEQVGD